MKKPTPNQKKAVFNNQSYRGNHKTRNTFYGRHDLLKRFHVTDKHKSWKEEI